MTEELKVGLIHIGDPGGVGRAIAEAGVYNN